MERQTPPLPVIPKAAATLILLRDGPSEPEVLLLKRHGLSDVLGEAHVFPGGKVDGEDMSDAAVSLIEESPGTLRSRLGEPDCEERVAAGLFIAAIREAMEESSILMAQHSSRVQGKEALSKIRAGVPFVQTLETLRLTLATSLLLPWSRWVTPNSPELQAKRFDARFFVARAPIDAIALHDGHETTESVWMNPRRALERYWRSEISLAPPQIMTLIHLASHVDVASVLKAAGERRPYLIEPAVVRTSAGISLCYPGDPGHDVKERRMPGPLRLEIRDKRYVPAGGFDAFFQ